MNHQQYMKRLKELSDKLQKAGNARPYNPDAYNLIIDELNIMHRAHYAELHSNQTLRFIRWAGRRSCAAARCLKRILRKVMSL